MTKDIHERTQAYAQLVLNVASIDAEAAIFLRTDALKLPHFGLHGFLDQCFVWDETPQGYEYWYNIAKQLHQQKDAA